MKKPVTGYQPTAAHLLSQADSLAKAQERAIERQLAAGLLTPAQAEIKRADLQFIIAAAKAKIDDAVWFSGAHN